MSAVPKTLSAAPICHRLPLSPSDRSPLCRRTPRSSLSPSASRQFAAVGSTRASSRSISFTNLRRTRVMVDRRRLALQLVVVSLFAMMPPTRATAIDNALLGEPEVQCGASTVEMQFRTKKMFTGKVYVKGHYNNPECRVDYSKTSEDGRPLGGIKLSHGACDMDRQRMISPQGMQFSAVLVVSFHPLFITKIDRAFNIKCMYRELTRTVSSQLEVSMLTTTQLEHTFPMPSCTYTIRKDEIDGEVLRYARVGEQVVHRWECQSDVYGILVHSCYVEDGQGEKQLIVDESGCHTDHFLLGDPTYVEALNMAYRESHVFKFADRVAVRFQCEIRLCLKEDGGCNGITPPICTDPNRRPSERLTLTDNNSTTTEATPTNATDAATTTPAASTTAAPARLRHRFVRSVSTSQQKETSGGNGGFDFRPVDGDLFSQYLYVLDSVEEPKQDDGSPKSSREQQSALQRYLTRSNGAIVSDVEGVCLSSLTFAILMGSLALVVLAVAFVAASICCQRMRAVLRSAEKGKTSSADTLWGAVQ